MARRSLQVPWAPVSADPSDTAAWRLAPIGHLRRLCARTVSYPRRGVAGIDAQALLRRTTPPHTRQCASASVPEPAQAHSNARRIARP